PTHTQNRLTLSSKFNLILPYLLSVSSSVVHPFLCVPQTMVTPLTQKYFGFGELENSIMYCVCGVVVILGFLFVRWLSKRVEERVVCVCVCVCVVLTKSLPPPLFYCAQHTIRC